MVHFQIQIITFIIAPVQTKLSGTHPKTKTRQRSSPSTPFPRPSFCLQR